MKKPALPFKGPFYLDSPLIARSTLVHLTTAADRVRRCARMVHPGEWGVEQRIGALSKENGFIKQKFKLKIVESPPIHQ